MTKRATIRKGFVSIDWLTADFRYSTELTVNEVASVWDQLRDERHDYFALDNIYISPISNPAMIMSSYSIGSIKKDMLQIVLLNDPKDTRPRFNTDNLLEWKDYKVALLIDSFMIRGRAHFPSTYTIDYILHGTRDAFFPVYEAQIIHASAPAITLESPAVLVNTKHINMICME